MSSMMKLLLLIFSLAVGSKGEGQSPEVKVNQSMNGKEGNLAQAILYEKDKSGRKINYFDYAKDFASTQLVVDRRGLEGVALLCVNGVFILYNNPFYDSYDYRGVSILSGEGECTNPGFMRSIRHAQSVRDISTDTLSLFQGKRLSGDNLIINEFNQDNYRLPNFGEIGSFIVIGGGEWEVVTPGHVYCIRGEGGSICPVAFPQKLFKKFHQADLHWLKVQKGCKGKVKVLKLSYCFKKGSGKLEPIWKEDNGTSEPEERIEKEVEKLIGNGTKVNETIGGKAVVKQEKVTLNASIDCEKSEELGMLLRFRLSNDFNGVYQLHFPLEKKFVWRTEIIDSSIAILLESLDSSLISLKMLRIIRELFIYKVEKHFWKGKGWPKPKRRVITVAKELERCLKVMEEKEWDEENKKVARRVGQNIEDVYGRVDEILKFRKLDVVMEFIWLSINFVGAACHQVMEGEYDFWMDYSSVAYDMYLKPMKEVWKEKKGIYTVVLGGFDIERMYKGLAAFVYEIYKPSGLDLMPRAEGV